MEKVTQLPILIVVLFISFPAYNQVKRKLLWAEEFNYNGLPDPKKWKYEEGFLRNNEAQYYTRANPENARVENGMLIIESIKKKIDTARYTSASLTTQDLKDFLYGRIEARAKLPVGRGTWPAIWLLGTNITSVDWPDCGEIDIMENVGFDSLRIHGNVHTKAYNHVLHTNKGNSIILSPPPYEDFHIYAVEWSKDKIDFYVDDTLYFTYTKESGATDAEWPFDKPHFLIINLAIGGGWGGQKGIDDRKFPHKFYVDYVRVYEIN